MSSHHTKKAVDTHHNQVNTAKLRKLKRRRQRQEAFEATRKAIKLQVAYWNLAKVGLILAWVTAVAVIVIFILRWNV